MLLLYVVYILIMIVWTHFHGQSYGASSEQDQREARINTASHDETSTLLPLHKSIGDEVSDFENVEDISAAGWLGYAIGLPRSAISLVVEWTVPDCSLPAESSGQSGGRPDRYPVTMLMCVVYIGLVSAGLVQCVEALMCNMQWSGSVIGLTVVAAGCQVPDLVSSLTATRNGQGGMALSNAVGSQTVNVLVGIGLPWTAFMIIHPDQTIELSSSGTFHSAAALFMAILVFFTALAFNSFILNRHIGAALLGCYAVYVAYLVLMAH